MYIVVSKWEPLPDKGDAWESISKEIRASLLSIPGVEFMHRFINEEGQVVVSMGYTDEDTYNALVTDPNGAVAATMSKDDIESYATWISSERGNSID